MILYIIIFAVAIFIAALALIPWRINLMGNAGIEGAGFEAHIRFIYGVVGLRFVQREKKYMEFLSLNFTLFRKELGKKEEKEEKEEGREGRGRKFGMSWLFRLPQLVENAQDVPELRKPAFRLLSKLKGAIRVKDFRINSRVGLGDPYSTGVLYGYYTAFLGAFGNWIPYGIYLQPDFMNEGVQGDFYAETEILQYSLIIPFLSLVVRKSFWDMARSFKGKKKENENEKENEKENE
ncbi:MAG: DUF2953 domain-containing protein [Archaeoglobaceae archaeon]